MIEYFADGAGVRMKHACGENIDTLRARLARAEQAVREAHSRECRRPFTPDHCPCEFCRGR